MLRNDQNHNNARCAAIHNEGRRRRARWQIALVLFGVLLISTARAQDAPPAGTPPPKAPSPSVRASYMPNLYDIDASGTDVKCVLEALARRSGANIVVSPDITGSINAHLKQMTVDSILDYLSTVDGFKWQKSGSTYLVANKDRFVAPPAPVEAPPPAPEPNMLIWECKYVKAADLAATVMKVYPNIKTAEGPGSLTPVITGSDAGSGGIMDTSDDSSGSSSSGSSSGASSSTGSLSGSGSASKGSSQQSSKIILMGNKEELDKAKNLLTLLDVRRKQVSIDVEITEINSTGSKQLGVQWSWNDAALVEAAGTGIGFGKFNKQAMTFDATINALIQEGAAKLLAQPNLSVMDGENAEILIGDRILYPKLIGYNQVGTPLYDKAEEKVGISPPDCPQDHW